MKNRNAVLVAISLLLWTPVVQAQNIWPGPGDDIASIGNTLESVQTLKALVAEQVNYYEVGVGGTSVLDTEWEKRHLSGFYEPKTALGHNLLELSELVASRDITVAVSNPTDWLFAWVTYYHSRENGVREELFQGGQGFKLFETKAGYQFPHFHVPMKMVIEPTIRLPGVQLNSVKVVERLKDGQITEVRYLPITWENGTPSFRFAAYYAEGEREGETTFQYWKDNKLQAKVFDLGTGVPITPSVASGSVSTTIDGVIVIRNGDLVLTLPEGGRVPLIQYIVDLPGGDYRLKIEGLVNGVPEVSRTLKVRRVGDGYKWDSENFGGIMEFPVPLHPETGVYWVIPDFEKYGKNLPPEFPKPQPPQPSVGGGGPG